MTVAQVPIVHPLDDCARHRAITAAYRSRIVSDAAEIRAGKTQLRELQRQGSDLAPGRQSALARQRDEARARLIAYGLHRGVALERMEAGRASLEQLPTRLHGLIRQAVERAEEDAAS